MSDFVLALDLETSGLNPKECSITEIGMVLYNGEEFINKFEILVNPEPNKKTYLGAMRVSNQTAYSLFNNFDRYNYTAAAHELLEYLTKTVMPIVGNKKLTLLGHNIMFDISFLKEFLDGNNIHGWDDLFNYSVKDTSTIGNFLRDCGVIKLEKMSLGNLADTLEVTTDKSKLHSALYDSELSAKCYFKMQKIIRSIHGQG